MLIVEIPVNTVELDTCNYHLLVEVVINDLLKTWWVIDTGASRSVMDASLDKYYQEDETIDSSDIQSAGIQGTQLDLKVGKIEKLDVGGFVVENTIVALIDLDHINVLYEKYSAMKISGLIGSDLLKKYGAVIDYEKSVLSLKNN